MRVMKKEFFSHLEQILYEADNERKFAQFQHFYDDFQAGVLNLTLSAKGF